MRWGWLRGLATLPFAWRLLLTPAFKITPSVGSALSITLSCLFSLSGKL
jgi:hypothetical protein